MEISITAKFTGDRRDVYALFDHLEFERYKTYGNPPIKVEILEQP